MWSAAGLAGPTGIRRTSTGAATGRTTCRAGTLKDWLSAHNTALRASARTGGHASTRATLTLHGRSRRRRWRRGHRTLNNRGLINGARAGLRRNHSPLWNNGLLRGRFGHGRSACCRSSGRGNNWSFRLHGRLRRGCCRRRLRGRRNNNGGRRGLLNRMCLYCDRINRMRRYCCLNWMSRGHARRRRGNRSRFVCCVRLYHRNPGGHYYRFFLHRRRGDGNCGLGRSGD
jgi:hypothetical protein